MSVSGGYKAAGVLCGSAALAYVLGRWLRLSKRSLWHAAIERTVVPLAFVALVWMNISGLVGTLTGGESSLRSGASTALIALPFYLLAIAAFVSDMAVGRRALPGFLDYLVYLMLPFKLLAGPLESTALLDKIKNCQFRLRFSRWMVAWPWLVLGAFMKYVVANRLDPARHLVSTDPITSFFTAAIFELKFYFDFAGYSFLAYGASLAVGLHISQNFNHPFLAPNVVLFWRRWHMSLGRFLGRYVLEPNLSLWHGRTQKMLFASAIFMVSAMWHGGTLNYLAWGFFHGACYFIYGQWLRRRDIPGWLGGLAMVLFFVFGRMFAVDADGARLLTRIARFFDPSAYSWPVAGPAAGQPFLTGPELRAVAVATLFIAVEVWSTRRYPHRPYHLFRRPLCALALLVVFLLAGTDTGTLLYARI